MGNSDYGENDAFVTLIRERGGSYSEYKKLSKRKISGSMKCERPFRMRGYFLDWSLKVGNGIHNHEMTL